MKLVKVQVTNYRSVEDSGEFRVDDMLCLVGKNEAGKTAVLQALAGLNPHPLTPFAYDKERDYPRRHLTAYDQRHPDEDAIVVTTWWTPSPGCVAAIAEHIGPNSLRTEPIKVVRRYEADDVEWEIPIDEQAVVAFLIEQERLDSEELQPLRLTNSYQLRKSLEEIEERTDRQNLLLDRMNAMPDKSATSLATSILATRLPKFMLFSHYDRMVGDMRVDDIWTASGLVDKSQPHAAAVSNASGLTPPRWL